MSDGLGMNNFLSDRDMHFSEVKLFKLLQFPFYTHYVDDSFVVFYLSQHNINAVFDLINSIDPLCSLSLKLKPNCTLHF